MESEVDHIEHMSFIYEIEASQNLNCEVCYKTTQGHDLLILSCGHKYCQSCLLDYLKWSKYSMKLYPLRCPGTNCNDDIFSNYKHLIPRDDYKSLKSIRKTFELMRAKNVLWCSTINCEGYAIIKNKRLSGHCVICNCHLTRQVDNEKERLIKDLSLLKCPKCSSLIYKEDFCMQVTCICGASFCTKCNSSSHNHNVYYCAFKPIEGRFSWWFVISFIYAYILFPFYPALVLWYYNEHWKPIWIFQNRRFRMIKVILLYVFSPMLFVIFLIYFSFKLTGKCIQALFDNRPIGKLLRVLAGALWLSAFPLVLAGVFLAFIIVIFVLPFFGVCLVVSGYFK